MDLLNGCVLQITIAKAHNHAVSIQYRLPNRTQRHGDADETNAFRELPALHVANASQHPVPEFLYSSRLRAVVGR